MKILNFLICLFFLCSTVAFASDVMDEAPTSDKATQVIEMEDNKINVIVMKQPLNEKSNQKIILKRNWLGVYIQVNGKVKVNPLTSTYEVE